jgi:hypothetical protein
MTNIPSRRGFLAAGLALPAAGMTTGSRSGAAPVTLRYRSLGKTGLKVTEMGFGCMITSDPSVIEKAADLGINYFDTARVYARGNNERMVGAVLKARRKSVYLSSKTLAATREQALADLDASLRELQTDYLDVWYLHDKRKGEDITGELMEAQRVAKKAGKIRFAGVSAHTGHESVVPAVLKARHFDVLLTAYHFAMDSAVVDPLLEQVHQAGIGIVAMKVMAGGLRKAAYYPSDDRTRARLSRPGAMLAALKWVLKNPNVDTTIPSIADADQLDEDFKAMGAPFTPADAKALAAHLEFIRPRYCRFCGRCEGTCPKGLPVSDVLRYLMYAEGYGQFPLGRERFRLLAPELQQVRCGDCAGCAVRCPNGVRVPQRLARAQAIFA